MAATFTTQCGSFYTPFPHEEGKVVFIRRALDNYHVCVQDTFRADLYIIVVDTISGKLALKIEEALIASPALLEEAMLEAYDPMRRLGLER
jgi:hypothetical protein